PAQPAPQKASDAAQRGVRPYAAETSAVPPKAARQENEAPAGAPQPFVRDAVPPLPGSAPDSVADAADRVRSDTQYELPPYIPARAVKRSAQSKRKAKKNSRSAKKRGGAPEKERPARGAAPQKARRPAAHVESAAPRRRLGIIIPCAVLGLIAALALVFLPSIRFAANLLSGNYEKAASVYQQSVGSSRLQSPVGEKIVQIVSNRALSSYLGGSSDYEASCARLDGIALIPNFTASANAVKTELTQQYASATAYEAAQQALAIQDYESAVEQLKAVSENSKYYDQAVSQLADTSELYKNETLTAIETYTSSADFEPLFTAADKALTLLDGDADIQKAYDNAETAFYNYAFGLMKQSVLNGDYATASRILTNAHAACPNGEKIAALYATYSPYLTAADVLDMAASGQTALSESTSVLSNYMPGTDADSAGKTNYGTGLVLRASVSDSFSRTYALGGTYSTLTGYISAVGAAGAKDTGCYARLTITGDGYTLYSSPYIYGDTQPAAVDVDVSGVESLTIRLEIVTHDGTQYAAGLLDFLLFPDMTGLNDLLEAA
ncbi:MAG: NPCBM/NEW2 domain-containing protein, partial [Oscillospiraceae bacterium]|nr:NPCBM/NEW2 domain-containing protein [Oscillospiraceae bacterium]